MKNLIYLSVLLSVWSLKLNAQDIDFPLLQSEIEKYGKHLINYKF